MTDLSVPVLGPLGLDRCRPARLVWKQAMGSTIHCVAGDATGIVLAATITALIGFPMWIDLIIEYVFGFALGCSSSRPCSCAT